MIDWARMYLLVITSKVIVNVGVAAIGFSIFTWLDYLNDFAIGVFRANSERDLDRAADDFAKAVSIPGIQAVLAVFFRVAKAPQTGKGGRLSIGKAPEHQVLDTYLQ